MINSSEFLMNHPVEVTTKITVKAAGAEIVLSLEAARALHAELGKAIGAPVAHQTLQYPPGVRNYPDARGFLVGQPGSGEYTPRPGEISCSRS
jgi:hypothetical protein